MTTNDYEQYTAFLRPDQWADLAELAKRKGLSSRQPLIRWAIDAFLLSEGSTCRSMPQAEQPEPAEATA